MSAATISQRTSDPAEIDAASAPPLAVDLDGTLIHVDTLHEGFVAACRAAPQRSWALVGALCQGKAGFKREVAQAVEFDPSLLPYNEEVLDYLREEKRKGRRIGLFTAAHSTLADSVAAHLGLFDVVRGSDGTENLSGARKLEAIRAAFGPDFAYAGDAPVDAPIFAAARSVILVGAPEALRRFVPAGTPVEAAFETSRWQPRVWARAFRLSHWTKNLLVFAAPILSLEIASPPVLWRSLALFVLLGILASATYLINDALDLPADRRHPTKRLRPLAAGTIPLRDAMAVAGTMVLGSLALSLALSPACTLSLAAYLVVTLAYSLALKRQPIVDVFVLAGLFTLRIVAGGAVIASALSPWLLTFSMLFFLGLAMIKRYAELERVVREGGEGVSSRGYAARDLPLLLATGVGSGLAAVVIFTIYLINEHYPQAVYDNPEALWALMPLLLLWTLRAWHLTVHGRMNEDPIVFALRDRTSLAIGALMGLCLLAAWS
jgi:4-hydroxybenzoate polyprenyltransferase/phosphoglycolate phosphatase-like HAD superfamily hydrolase